MSEPKFELMTCSNRNTTSSVSYRMVLNFVGQTGRPCHVRWKNGKTLYHSGAGMDIWSESNSDRHQVQWILKAGSWGLKILSG